MKKAAFELMITCEHAGNEIPGEYQNLFARRSSLLETHRGFDRGALEIAKAMSKELKCILHFNKISRLLIDANRSINHRDSFSTFTNQIANDKKKEIIKRYYQPYRESVMFEVAELLRSARTVIHVSIHSFTPVFKGVTRNADFGLLFDSRRRSESSLCNEWKKQLIARLPNAKIRRNYPYNGKNDGLTSAVRKLIPQDRYLGVELEVNQKIVRAKSDFRPKQLARVLSQCLLAAIDEVDV